MNSSSSRAASNIETSQLSMTLDEAWANILPFLDIPTSPRVFQSFRQQYAAYMEPKYLRWNPIAHLYEQFIFSKEDDILPPTSESIHQPLYFRSNVNLSSKGIAQPKGVRIHLFTTSDSEEFHLEEVSSMFIRLSTSDCGSDDFELNVVSFFEHLITSRLRSLKNFKLSRFNMIDWLWKWLSQLDLDWVHYTSNPTGGLFTVPQDCLKPGKLHMDLRNGSNVYLFPKLPPSLEELSLHISVPCLNATSVNISHCRNLRRM